MEPNSLHPIRPYRGRLAPSPTGLLHLGHARTFALAARRAREEGGELLLRNDDLDRARCRPEFVEAMQEDLRWLRLAWTGPMITQSERIPLYRKALGRLHEAKLIFPCSKSRRDVAGAAGAPDEAEPLYPVAFRPPEGAPLPGLDDALRLPAAVNWRFRVPDGEEISFRDGRLGECRAVAGRDFGDFLVWRKDGTPSYQLACAVDDAELGITEVVRGEDLVGSTYRQLLLHRALGQAPPAFHHGSLVADERGARLAKRHDSLSLRALRLRGETPESICAAWSD